MRILLAFVLSGLAACAPVRAPAPLPGQPLAEDVALLRGRFVAGTQPDGNTLMLRGRDGWIVIDSGRHAEHTGRIVAAVAGSGLPLRAIVNTHWHLDHVAGNAALREAHPHAQVWASPEIERALDGFLADYRRQLDALLAKPPADGAQAQALREERARLDTGPRLLPTHPITAGGERTLAGRRVVFGVEADAVSGGDVWLFDPGSGVLAAGDLVTLPVPLLDTACAEGWRAALARLDAVPFTTLVPGHGAPLDRVGFARYRGAFDRLLACAAGDGDARACNEQWLRDVDGLVAAEDVALARSLLDYYVPHVLRAPPERRARFCRSSG